MLNLLICNSQAQCTITEEFKEYMVEITREISPGETFCFNSSNRYSFVFFNQWDNIYVEPFFRVKLADDPILVNFLPVNPDDIVGFSFGRFYGDVSFKNPTNMTQTLSITANRLYSPQVSLYVTNRNSGTWYFPNTCQNYNDMKYYRYYLNMGSNNAKYNITTTKQNDDSTLEITDSNDTSPIRITKSTKEKILETSTNNPQQFMFYSQNKNKETTITVTYESSSNPRRAVSGCFQPTGLKWILMSQFEEAIPTVITQSQQWIVFVVVGIVMAALVIAAAIGWVFHRYNIGCCGKDCKWIL